MSARIALAAAKREMLEHRHLSWFHRGAPRLCCLVERSASRFYARRFQGGPSDRAVKIRSCVCLSISQAPPVRGPARQAVDFLSKWIQSAPGGHRGRGSSRVTGRSQHCQPRRYGFLKHIGQIDRRSGSALVATGRRQEGPRVNGVAVGETRCPQGGLHRSAICNQSMFTAQI